MKQIILSFLMVFGAMTSTAADYNITAYGAVSDTSRLSTDAVQRAIDECSQAGGGRVLVPTGSYKIGTIVLKSNVNLHLEHGATLYGSTRLEDYRPMKSDYVSLRTQTETIQLIYADDVAGVVIDGHGTIDGRGRSFKKLSWNDEGITRPHLLRIIRGRDITVRDITLRNSGCWMQHYLACDRVRIDGIRVFNRNNYNNDNSLRSKVSPAYMQYIESSLINLYKNGIISSQDLDELRKEEYSRVNLLENAVAQPRYVSDFFTVRTAYEFIINNCPSSRRICYRAYRSPTAWYKPENVS